MAVYAALGLSPSQTYIVGRAVRKLQAQCQVRAKCRLGLGAGGGVEPGCEATKTICVKKHPTDGAGGATKRPAGLGGLGFPGTRVMNSLELLGSDR